MADGQQLVANALEEILERSVPSLARQVAPLAARGSTALRLFLESEVHESVGPSRWPEFLADLIGTVSVWFPPSVCNELPVLLPHVKRDNGCRRASCATHVKKAKGRVGEPRDLWSTPTHDGYLRDDNSLIKELVGSLRVTSPHRLLSGEKLGAGFVACHISAMANADDPWLNSFIPNLVWLPKPLDVLSDREQGVAQQVLREMSTATYGANMSSGIAEGLWAQLPPISGARPTAARNMFEVTPSWLKKRIEKIVAIERVLAAIARGDVPSTRTRHTHYDAHVADIQREAVMPLAERLASYAARIGRRS